MKFTAFLLFIALVSFVVPVFAENSSETKWSQVRREWLKSDDGRHVLGSKTSVLHSILGQPSITFSRSQGLTEDMWSTPKQDGYISVVYKDGKATQIETEIMEPNGKLLPGATPLTLAEVKQHHPKLHVSAYGYDLPKHVGENGHDEENARDEEMKH